MIATRPGGISSSTVRSRSPKMTMAAVRGMGVAVMTRRSGSPSSPLARSVARCSTPKRCCSSMTTMPSDLNATSSVRRAWVPTTMATAPLARSSSMVARALPLTRLVSSSTRTSRSPSIWRTATACCSARTSVGTIRAPWCPLWTAPSRAARATTVLPEPTSPWSSRCMGKGPARSATITASVRRCAVVSSKGRAAKKRATRVPPTAPVISRGDTSWRRARALCSKALRRRTRASWRRNSSSNTSRRRAGAITSLDSGP